MNFVNWFKKQNKIIKSGYISLAISLVVLLVALVLLGSANFVPKDINDIGPDNANLVGNGFQVMIHNKITDFLTAQGYQNFNHLYTNVLHFTSAPLTQLVVGIIFLIILLPIFGGLAILLLLGGYFKRWLYT
ncbi:MAG: hypothetical protein REH79_03565 [Spiroplasma sp.]|nr:hypothetical protein [Spiroplasma sp.]